MPATKNKVNSRPTTYAVYALGCQQNWYDAEQTAYLCDQLGLYPEKPEQADLVIVFSCSVRQKAVDRLHGFMAKWRKITPHQEVLVTACVLPHDRPKLSEHARLIPDQEIRDYLIKRFGKPDPARELSSTSTGPAQYDTEPNHAFIPITIGCNNFCTFCAVPHTRGREQSRPAILVLAEIAKNIKQGKTNITLLGQNVNSFGLSDFNPRDLRKNRDRSGTEWSPEHPSPFVELLRKVDQLDQIGSVAFLSPNPQDFSSDLIDYMAKSRVFTRTLNLPLQSGSDRILKLMNRRYSQAEYLKLVDDIRTAVPDIIISTDIIVGFPTETDADFTETMKVVHHSNFAKVFIGIYSPRQGTASTKLYPDDVPYTKKHERFTVLNDLLNKQETKLDARTAGRIVI
ncbi:MAG: MiaB/RimO family radical SAM methylthiotransferase [bacterium]|nr:MiaB/RimO family radical SAM methylthiotransferase [bacterium]